MITEEEAEWYKRGFIDGLRMVLEGCQLERAMEMACNDWNFDPNIREVLQKKLELNGRNL